jgi:hypothetical protein
MEALLLHLCACLLFCWFVVLPLAEAIGAALAELVGQLASSCALFCLAVIALAVCIRILAVAGRAR